MYIIIVGAGEVGSYLGRILVEQDHEVAIIEIDERLAREIDARLDALVVHGSGASRETLLRAGIERTDLILAVTGVDEVNLIACMTAEKYGKQPRTVARVQTQYLFGEQALSADDLGLNLLIGPERAVAETATELLRFGEIRHLIDDQLVLLEMVLGPDSPLIHETLAEIRSHFPRESLVVAVQGAGEMRIPRGDTRLRHDERAYVLTLPRHVDEFLLLSGKPWFRVQNILIVGCGNIGFYLAQALEGQNIASTIIERDAERAEWMAARLEHSVVVGGDGTDPEFLREQIEGGEIHAVVVLVEDDEQPLLIGLFAKSLGARKVIVRSDKTAYTPLAHQLGVDAVINPRRAVADGILRYTRRGRIASTVMLGEHEGEIVEIEVPEAPANRDLVTRPLSELDFPEGSLLGGVIRGGQVWIPDGDTVLQAGDLCLLVTLPRALHRLERLFE